MKMKRIFALALSVVVSLTTVSVQAAVTNASEEPVKYENELYHIGYDIPADSYLLIPKDNTKPAFVGVYSNAGNPKGELRRYYEISVGAEIDYIYPHYFDQSEKFSEKAEKAIENEGKCLYSQYFEFTGLIDLSSERNKTNPSYNFLCLENCYAVSVKYADKLEWDPDNSGFMPMSTFYKKGDSYSIKPSENKPRAEFACYKYDKITGNIEPLTSCYVDNPLYIQYTDPNRERTAANSLISIPNDTDIVFKKDAEIFDIKGNIVHTDKNYLIPDNYTEKFNFNDITKTYKMSVIQQLLNVKANLGVNLIKDLTSSAKTDADKEYCRYAREIGVISGGSIYEKIFIERYLTQAVSFKDLEQLLRYIVYLNPMWQNIYGTVSESAYGINFENMYYNVYDPDYKTPKLFSYYY